MTRESPRRDGSRARDLKIAILSDAVPGRNGVGTYYDDLAPHLRERVAEVQVLAPPADWDQPYEGWYFVMPGDPTQRLWIPGWRKLWKEIREMDPDVVISASPGFYGLLGPLIAARVGAPFITAHHTEISQLADLYWSGLLGRVNPFILGVADRWLFSRSSMIMVHNEELVPPVRERGGSNIRLVGTAIPKRFFTEAPAPLSPVLDTVTFLGRLAPEKRLDQVRDAAKAFPDKRFRIVGEGPLRSDVEEWAADLPNLDYTPWVPREEVMRLLDASDLVVLPSRFETFGTAAFEAMARGRLALVSRHCGIANWPELSGGLVRMEEDEDLTDGIRRVEALSAEERARIAGEGRRATRAFTDEAVDQWVELVEETVAAHPGL